MPGKADFALRNGIIYLPGSGRTFPGSVAVEGALISYCGPDKGIAPFLGPNTETINLQGKMVSPALHDSHIHSIFGGLFLLDCELTGLSSPAQYLAAIADYANKYPGKTCIRGYGWIQTVFDSRGPHKQQLDAIVNDRPVLLYSSDGHCAWANSAMLALSGISRNTPDPPGGIIERDETWRQAGFQSRNWKKWKTAANNSCAGCLASA